MSVPKTRSGENKRNITVRDDTNFDTTSHRLDPSTHGNELKECTWDESPIPGKMKSKITKLVRQEFSVTRTLQSDALEALTQELAELRALADRSREETELEELVIRSKEVTSMRDAMTGTEGCKFPNNILVEENWDDINLPVNVCGRKKDGYPACS